MRLLFAATTSILLTLGEARFLQQFGSPVYQGPQAPLGIDGRVVDTEEVARAKAEHFAARAEALARLRNPYDNNLLAPDHAYYSDRRFYDQSLAPIGSDGRVMDTPEVARAKAAHLAEHARAAARTTGNYVFDDAFDDQRNFLYARPTRITYPSAIPYVYRGPPAPLGPDGRVIETPEVARAREAHLQAHARAASLAAYGSIYY